MIFVINPRCFYQNSRCRSRVFLPRSWVFETPPCIGVPSGSCSDLAPFMCSMRSAPLRCRIPSARACEGKVPLSQPSALSRLASQERPKWSQVGSSFHSPSSHSTLFRAKHCEKRLRRHSAPAAPTQAHVWVSRKVRAKHGRSHTRGSSQVRTHPRHARVQLPNQSLRALNDSLGKRKRSKGSGKG